MRRREKAPQDLAVGVPPELLGGYLHPMWRDLEATSRWYVDHIGKTPQFPPVSTFWQVRWGRAKIDWAVHNGIVHPDNPKQPDHLRIEALGIHRVPKNEA